MDNAQGAPFTAISAAVGAHCVGKETVNPAALPVAPTQQAI